MEGQSQRRKSFVQAPTVEVIFEGSKTYWKARTTLEILIAFHLKQACYEVIVFHPDVGKEAPRIYLSAPILASKIDQKELQQRIADKKEAFIRSKKPANQVQITKECLEALIVQFVLNRLNIILGTAPEDFSMAILPQTGDVIEDEEKRRMDVELARKPDNVVPLESSFQKKIT
ncbi:hypothetical protein EON65_43550 [archaeon]|nr:MAG: hypothetical protein EON65_43550 [archaeon]